MQSMRASAGTRRQPQATLEETVVSVQVHSHHVLSRVLVRGKPLDRQEIPRSLAGKEHVAQEVVVADVDDVHLAMQRVESDLA